MGRLTSDEISDYIQSHSKSLSDNQTTILNNVSDLTWFRQYAKKSKSNLRKITARVKKGIKQGKYNTSNLSERGGGEKAFKLPKPKKEKGEKKKQAKQPKIKPENKRTYTPKTKQRVENAKSKYPQASNYELRHGVNSKASMDYRERRGLPRGYKDSLEHR